MGKIATVLVLFVCVVSSSTEGNTQTLAWETPRASISCVEELSTGFNWHNGRWMQAKFVPAKYLIKKIDPSELAPSVCGINLDKPLSRDFIVGDFADLKRCYNIRDLRSQYSVIDSQICDEYYSRVSGAWKLKQISCSSMKLLPDGWFHHASLHEDLSAVAKDDYKDSLSISVGHCSSG